MGIETGSLDSVFGALADPTRRLILDELHRRDRQSLFEICGRIVAEHDVSLSRQAISKHLKLLECANLIRTEWQGRTKLHSLKAEPIDPAVSGWLKKFIVPRGGQ